MNWILTGDNSGIKEIREIRPGRGAITAMGLAVPRSRRISIHTLKHSVCLEFRARPAWLWERADKPFELEREDHERNVTPS